MRALRSTLSLALFLLVGCGANAPSGDEAPDAGATDAPPDDAAPTTDTTPTPDASLPPLEWTACDTTVWYDGYPKPAPSVRCTMIDVPLDRKDPSAGTISLRVARQSARHAPTGKAIFQIAGGPGGTSVGQTGVIPQLFPRLLDDFDLVYVDQRGTGGSGYLDCPGGYPDTDVKWQACAKAIADKPLQHMLTADAADDIDAVRARLGYDKMFVRGGSYGTRVGLELMRRHASSIAAIVLDGVDPPDSNFFEWMTQQFDSGVDWLVRDCSASDACLAVSPHLLDDLVAYRKARAGKPRPIVVGGSPDVEDETLFLQALESTLYDAQTRALVPHAIHDAIGGDTARWDAILTTLFGVTVSDGTAAIRLPAAAHVHLSPFTNALRGKSYVAPGTWLAVVCAEDWPNSGSVSAIAADVAKQTWPEDSPNTYATVCASFSAVTPVDAAERAPVVSDVPALLLSGGVDLQTPTAWGEQALHTLSHAQHLVVPNATHGTMLVPCVANVISDYFLAAGDMSKVDTSCIAATPPPHW